VKYLLDTDVLSDVIRNRLQVSTRFSAVNREDLAVSVVTIKELEFGRQRLPEGAWRYGAAMDNTLRDIKVLAFRKADAVVTGRIRAALERVGTPIGRYDVMIAGTALAHNLTLVTANTREFSRVPNLRIEDWRMPYGVRECRPTYGYFEHSGSGAALSIHKTAEVRAG
jgi:tRNA(fMet)-specific endonuclease VapC